MWQEAKANDRKIKEVMADHKKRAERRRAYYNSKIGDPRQLLRIIGSNVKLYPNGEQYYFHENTNNLMPWQGDTTVRIDRFDGRSLLDVIPQSSFGNPGTLDDEDFDDREELNFERYRDLVEADRLHLTEKQRLESVENEWVKLLDRHKALMEMINPQKKKSNAIGYDYGTNNTSNDGQTEESDILNEVDILKYVNELTEKDRLFLNDMGKKYGIRNYARLLRVAKRDRDVDLNNLKARQLGRDGISKPESKKSKRRKRKRGSRWELDLDGTSRRKRRASPSYGDNDSDDDDDSSGTNDDEHGSSADEKSDFVIEFGSTPEDHSTPSISTSNEAPSATIRASSTQQSVPASTTERKLTPMEKLKMKMRAGLEKTIQSDETAKLQKKQERQLEGIEHYVKERNGLDALAPIVKSINPIQSTLPATTSTTRYRSPSSSRSPSPSRMPSGTSKRSPSSKYDNSKDTSHRSSRTNKRQEDTRERSPRHYRSPKPSSRHRSRSPTSSSRHRRSRSRSPASSGRRRRSRSRSPKTSSRHRRSRSRSPASSSRRRSRSRSPTSSSRRRSPTSHRKKERK